jgi:hypothetical protein
VRLSTPATRQIVRLAIRELDGNAVHERIVDVPADRRIGNFIDEVFEKVWTEMESAEASKYKIIVEAAD